MEAGQLPIATSLVAVVQIGTELGVIDVRIDCGGHFEHDEARGGVARAASGAVGGCTEGAGEAEVKGGAGEPTEATVDIALRRQFNGMGRKCIVRQPPARVFGKRRAEGVSVVLVESMGMGDKGVEIQGRELLVGK